MLFFKISVLEIEVGAYAGAPVEAHKAKNENAQHSPFTIPHKLLADTHIYIYTYIHGANA